MFDLYILYILVLKSIILFKECRVQKLSLVRANNLNLFNHYMLCKINMTLYKHLPFRKIVNFN